MYIKKLILDNFKKINTAAIDLHQINILVGGNNSGKSSILQGIHFSVITAIGARQFQKDTFSSDALLFCPSNDFTLLRHRTPYLNRQGYANSKLSITADGVGDEEREYEILIYRGRNQGNIGCQRKGDYRLGQKVTSPTNFFSIYVPGLAGIQLNEEYRSSSIIYRNVASGDANLYLRNVLLKIKQEKKLTNLRKFMRNIFPNFKIKVVFRGKTDLHIKVDISINGHWIPIELAGTGVLQALQIFSYITLFQPSLLLLDEPDSHLHPDNQLLLAETLQTVADESETQIIATTHSRHLVDALYGEANFVWVKDGLVEKQGTEIPKLPLLVDIGALDSFDQLQNGEIAIVFLTEDSKTEYIELLLEANGFDLGDVLIYTYKSSSNLDGALLLVDFIKEIAAGCEVILHRDRDFMTDEEVAIIENKINDYAIPFITKGSDIESYFISPQHLAEIFNQDLEVIEGWLHELSVENHNKIQHTYTRKRDEIKRSLYRGRENECPVTINLIGNQNPLQHDKWVGKFMLKKVRGSMQEQFGESRNIVISTQHLACERLEEILEDIE